MASDRWPDVERLFHAAMARPPHEREAFLRQACGDDDELHGDVLALVRSGATTGRLLDRVVARAVAAASGAVPGSLTGQRLGVYEIGPLLGAGGMGEVYRARDTRLRRDVAVKVLPDVFTEDPDRLSRFDQEAHALAALNHPHIAAIYGIEESSRIRALILEFVDGDTLAERLARGSLSLDEALTIGWQVADALHAAHRRGIIHRDLKPANIKLTRDGAAKVLDFGLAKTYRTDQRADGIETLEPTPGGTLHGVVLGTPAYMSPEQARGQPVGFATDVWGFGCVLFEILAGRPPFDGDTSSDIIARVLEREPDWDALPASTPEAVRRLLSGCLQKATELRTVDLAEVRRQLEDVLAALRTGHGEHDRRRRPRWAAVIGGAAAAVAGVSVTALLIYRSFDREPPSPRLSNPVQRTSAIGVEDYPSWSPDGRGLAYESNERGNWDIAVTQLGSGGSVIRTLDHDGDDRYPSWSPDGLQIAFWSGRDGGGYYVMPALGGPPTKVAPAPMGASFYGPAVWSADSKRLAYVTVTLSGDRADASLRIVDVGTRQTTTLALPGTQQTRLDLSWSPDERFMAYVDAGQQPAETTQVMILRLSDGVSIPVTDALANARSPQWGPSGRALYFVSNRLGAADLWRRRIDVDGSPAGEPERVTTGLEVLHAGFSATGTRLAYAKGRWVSNVFRVPLQMGRPAAWAEIQQVTFDQAFLEFVDVSRDGRRLLFSSDRAGNQDLWMQSIEGGEPMRLTSDPAPEWGPRWSPDERRISFYASRTGDREIWVMPADGGPATQLTSSPGLDALPDWSPDGRELAFRSERSGSSDVWVVPADGGPARQLAPHSAPDYAPSWSPDGRWLVFGSSRDNVRGAWRVPASGGVPEPLRTPGAVIYTFRLSRDGETIFYMTEPPSSNLWALSVKDQRRRQLTSLAGRRGTLGGQPPAADEEYLYFTWREDVADIWTMDVLLQE